MQNLVKFHEIFQISLTIWGLFKDEAITRAKFNKIQIKKFELNGFFQSNVI